MPKHFTKVTEDFACEFCYRVVNGNGYTNHCQHCLYSKHVDHLSPGDRSADCHGMMIPIGLTIKNGRYVIFHRCSKCNKITRNKTSPKDNPEKLITLSTKPIK